MLDYYHLATPILKFLTMFLVIELPKETAMVAMVVEEQPRQPPPCMLATKTPRVCGPAAKRIGALPALGKLAVRAHAVMAVR